MDVWNQTPHQFKAFASHRAEQMNFANDSLQFLDFAERAPTRGPNYFWSKANRRPVPWLPPPLIRITKPSWQCRASRSTFTKPARRAVQVYPFFTKIEQALGLQLDASSHVGEPRFGKVILLFDPDADGIHCGVLMMIYSTTGCEPDWIPVASAWSRRRQLGWFGQNRRRTQARICYSPDQARTTLAALNAAGITDIRKTDYRELASIEHDCLSAACVAPVSQDLPARLAGRGSGIGHVRRLTN